MSLRTRRATMADLQRVLALRAALWSEESTADASAEVAAILSGSPPGTMPIVVIVAEVQGEVVGFIEVGLRSHADGCDPRRPVGFVEAWYVQAKHRRRAVGRALMAAAEEWALSRGAHELASDTWLANDHAHRAHEALGFEVVDRCVNYRKSIV